ncbi:MAG: Fe-S cluster assembly ATPase SufC [Defluviitaleaceae bacterium]|nr:Fe-S cluster assembly ATPase SufC [Defluviitaleaceae bacterium]
MSKPVLKISDLRASVEEKEILKGVNLEIKGGEIHAIMGPNGTGKSTLSQVVMGHPSYEVLGGEITMNGEDVLEMEVDERAHAGLFLAMQYPSEIPGVTNSDFLRMSKRARLEEGEKEQSLIKFINELDATIDELKIQPDMAHRYLNEGFSGGEKKRNEILQMKMLKPEIAILDEIDSGLDVDALKIVGDAVNSMRSEEFGALIITHYQRILDYITPDFVHVMMQGRIVKSGGIELMKKIDEEGYEWIKEELGIEDERVIQDEEKRPVRLDSCGTKEKLGL